MLCHNRSNQAIDVPKKQTIQRNKRRAHGDSRAPNGKKPLFRTNKSVLDSAKKPQCSSWNMRFPLVRIDLRGPVSGNCVSLILSTDQLMGAACRLGETVTADN